MAGQFTLDNYYRYNDPAQPIISPKPSEHIYDDFTIMDGIALISIGFLTIYHFQ